MATRFSLTRHTAYRLPWLATRDPEGSNLLLFEMAGLAREKKETKRNVWMIVISIFHLRSRTISFNQILEFFSSPCYSAGFTWSFWLRWKIYLFIARMGWATDVAILLREDDFFSCHCDASWCEWYRFARWIHEKLKKLVFTRMMAGLI